MALYWGGTKGGNQSVDFGNVTTGDTTDMSIVAWVRTPNNFSGAGSVLDRRGDTVAKERFWLLSLGDNAGKADFRFIRGFTTTNASAISTQTFDTDDNSWYFIGGTHAGTAAPKLYWGTQSSAVAEVTYASQTAPAGALRTGAQPMSLGQKPAATNTGFGGAISLVAMFDVELTQAEIENMRLGGLKVILKNPNLTHCFVTSFYGTTGTVYDISPAAILAANNVNGTISGTLTQVENPGSMRSFPFVGYDDWSGILATAAAGPATITASSAVTIPAVTVTSAAERIITTSSTITTPTVTITSAAERIVTATSAIALPATTITSVAERIITASSAVLTPSTTITAAAERIVTALGDINLPPVTITSTAERIITSSANVTSGSTTISSTGTVGGVVTASAAITTPAVTITSVAERIISGTSTVSVPAVGVSAVAERIVLAAAAIGIPPTAINASASIAGAIASTVAISAPAVTVASTAERTVVADGAINAPAILISSIAERTVTGQANITAPPIVLSSIAERVITADCAITIGAVTIVGSQLPIYLRGSFPGRQGVGRLLQQANSGSLLQKARGGRILK